MDQKKKALLISQELFFAKTLAGNDKTKRDRALKKLHRWLYARTHDGVCGFNEEDFMRIWKGLFYCMWMSDKPLIQEEVAENISKLVHSVDEGGSVFIKCFFVTMAQEWNGIDQHRLDKFQMLVRRFLRQTLEWARKADWSVTVPALTLLFEETILKPTGAQEGMPIGLLLHFADIFMEELAKVVDENGLPPNSDVVIQILRPFARLLARNDDPRIVKSVIETVFHHLMRQSDVGLDYEELRSKGWCQRKEDLMEDDEGIGGEGEEEDEEDGEESEGEEEEEEGMVLAAKDPRAGGVDVVLPQLDVDFHDLASMLEDEVKDPSIRPKLRRRLEDLARKFRSITRGRYPLQIGTVPSEVKWKKSQRSKAVRKAALELMKNEEKLLKAELGEDEMPRKKKPAKLNNGKLPEGEETRKGRKRKRGKRKSRAERRKASVNKAEENGVSGRDGAECCAEEEVEELIHPPKKRRSISEGWHVGELKLSPKDKRVVNDCIGGEWSVMNSDGKDIDTVTKKCAKSKGSIEVADGYETEVVIKNLKPNPFSPIGRKVITPRSIKKEGMGSASKIRTPSSDKRVKIVLSRNLSQETHEYHKSLRASPAIPFDPSKVPAQGVLKATSSPIMLNPFYRTSPRRQKMLLP